MRSPTKPDVAHRLDAEWERLCRAVGENAKTEAHESLLRPSEAVRAKILDAWRCSLGKDLPARNVARGYFLMAGALVAVVALR